MTAQQQLYIKFIQANGKCGVVDIRCSDCPYNEPSRICEGMLATPEKLLQVSVERYVAQWGTLSLLEELL